MNRPRYFVVPYSKCDVWRELPWCSKDFLLRHRASHHFYDVFTKLTGWAALFASLLLFDDLNPKINFPETKKSLTDWGFDMIWWNPVRPWNKCSLSFMGYMLLLCLFCWWNFRVSLSTTPLLEPLLRGAVSHHRTTLCKSITSTKFLRIHVPWRCFFVTPFPHAPTNGFVIYICVEFMVNKRTPQV